MCVVTHVRQGNTLTASSSPRAECALHHHAVKPAAKLMADTLERADHTKAGGAMQFD